MAGLAARTVGAPSALLVVDNTGKITTNEFGRSRINPRQV